MAARPQPRSAPDRRSRRHAPVPIEAEPLLTTGQRRWVLAFLAGGVALGLTPVLRAPWDSGYWVLFALLPGLVMPLAWFLAGDRLGRRLDAWLLLGNRGGGVQLQDVASMTQAARQALERAALPALLGAVSRVANGKRAELATPARHLLATARARLLDPAAIALLIDHLPATVAALEASHAGAGPLAAALAEALERPGAETAGALATALAAVPDPAAGGAP
ncbi:hypothetical protein [Roseomonas sp. USHLN139]|uniref:hypothetical protein n=1 Tax=Roseomonas sp. USHLN139 TaxID=3081298 RepID=UPI003B0240CA